MYHRSVLFAAASAMALLPAGTVGAETTLSAYSDYAENGIITQQDSKTGATHVGAATWGGAGNSWAAAVAEGYLDSYASAGSCGEACSIEFLPPDGSFTVTTLSEARWETTVRNGFGTAQDYSFHFNVADHYLQTTDRVGDRAGFGIDILLDGVPIWSVSALLDGATLTASPAFGTPIGDNWGDGWNVYGFGDLSMTVNLGSIAAGSPFTLSYTMTAFAEAVIDADDVHIDRYEDEDGVWGWWYVSRDPVFSGVRDPLGVSFTNEPSVAGPVGPAVPEPASWAMLLAGFGLLGATLRRRRVISA